LTTVAFDYLPINDADFLERTEPVVVDALSSTTDAMRLGARLKHL